MTILPFADRSALPTDTEYRLLREAGERYRAGRCCHPGCPHLRKPHDYTCGRDGCYDFVETVDAAEFVRWATPEPAPLTVLVALTWAEYRLHLAGAGIVGGALVVAAFALGVWQRWLHITA